MQRLVLSVSTQASKILAEKLPRMGEGTPSVGATKLQSNSVQVSWQVHAIQLNEPHWGACANGDYVFFFVEAHSRFTIVKPYAYHQRPSYQQLVDDFKQLWFVELFKHMLLSGVVSNNQQADALNQQYIAALESAEIVAFNNYDLSIGGSMTDHIEWLQVFIDGKRLKRFSEQEADEFTDYLNQIEKRIRDKKANKKNIINPIEFFVEDSAFRFAKGLCNDRMGDCRGDNFPNPHQHKVQLRVVK
jgi:hypothetical protein